MKYPDIQLNGQSLTPSQAGVTRAKMILSVVTTVAVIIGAVVGFGYVRTSTANAQATGDIIAVKTFMKTKFDADKKYPEIPLSNNSSLASKGYSLLLTDGNKVSTTVEDESWKGALQSQPLKDSGSASWFCFGNDSDQVAGPKDDIGDCLSGVVEGPNPPTPSASPTASASSSATATASPTASAKASPSASPAPTYTTTPAGLVDAGKYISANTAASCLIRETAYCWGTNQYGENGTLTAGGVSAVPTKVVGEQFTNVAVGIGFNCGISNGDVYCWGQNDRGQLGYNGNGRDEPKPWKIDSDQKFTSIVAGEKFACGIAETGKAICWGEGYGPKPLEVSSDDTFVFLTAGAGHACGLTSASEAYCWGKNGFGQLGDGTTTTSYTARHVTAGGKFTSISAGNQHSCGVTDGKAVCWGDNFKGQLGGVTAEKLYAPVTVLGNHPFESVYAGSISSCGITNDGTAYCWGQNYKGLFGSGNPNSGKEPVKVYGDTKFKSLSVASDHVCGVSTIDEFYCWGANGQGQIGNSTYTDAVTPVKVVLN